MLCSQLISLFIIFGLINYSYEFNLQKHYIQRRNQENELKELEQDMEETASEGQQDLEKKTEEAGELDKQALETICHQVTEALNQMTAMGSQDVSYATHWTSIQAELRKGIEVIIEAYRRYIKFHRQICENIEDFANRMITKYEGELAAIDQMTVPSDTTDINSDSWTNSANLFPSRVHYARLHQQTLSTAADCTNDLVRNAVQFRGLIFRYTPPRRIIHLVQISSQRNPSPIVHLPCNEEVEDNGCECCSKALVTHTRSFANRACGGCIQNYQKLLISK